MKRIDFLKTGLLGLIPGSLNQFVPKTINTEKGPLPVAISTWNTGTRANAAAWEILSKKDGYALDAVEAGVKVEEADPNNMSVGYGGRPDREGIVTLDACVMDETGECGAVAAIQDIKHPISVARKVMTETPHWMLVGAGARQFALEQGFQAENLLTEKAEKAWKNWLKNAEYKPVINIENHDTIGMLAVDQQGRVCGGCTTSGAAWKMHGRVGDSPIIGAGLFVDPNVGGATATGLGEEVVKTAGAALIVEKMREGYTPSEACKIAVERIVERRGSNKPDFQVGYIALNKDGAFGGYSVVNGFTYAVYNEEGNRVIKSEHLI